MGCAFNWTWWKTPATIHHDLFLVNFYHVCGLHAISVEFDAAPVWATSVQAQDIVQPNSYNTYNITFEAASVRAQGLVDRSDSSHKRWPQSVSEGVLVVGSLAQTDANVLPPRSWAQTDTVSNVIVCVEPANIFCWAQTDASTNTMEMWGGLNFVSLKFGQTMEGWRHAASTSSTSKTTQQMCQNFG